MVCLLSLFSRYTTSPESRKSFQTLLGEFYQTRAGVVEASLWFLGYKVKGLQGVKEAVYAGFTQTDVVAELREANPPMVIGGTHVLQELEGSVD